MATASIQRVIIERLAELQYTRNQAVFGRGTYRVLGDVIDIFPAESERDAIRIELFDDVIESIKVFDPLSGHVNENVARFTVFPKTHYVTHRQRPSKMLWGDYRTGDAATSRFLQRERVY